MLERYGKGWKEEDDAYIEMEMIRRGGFEGGGVLPHYLKLRKILWPHRHTCSWTELIYREILQNQMTILMGCASSWKTSTIAEFVLIDYWCYPEITAVLVSTTTRDKLEEAIYGEIKMLWQMGRARFDWLAGHMVDAKQAIFTDDVQEVEARDYRKAVKGKACYVGQNYVGLGAFAGIKQKRLRFAADELQYMPSTFLDCLPNMLSNPDVKVIGSGNPNHDPNSQLAIAAEPLDGWASVEALEVTTVWDTKFYRSRCVNLIGTDSDNFKLEPGQAEIPGLIGPRFARNIIHDYGEHSPQFETQVKGRMKLGLSEARVITRQVCREHRAHDRAVWSGKPITRVHACDPAYGGSSRCISGHIEFGESVEGKIIVRVPPPHIIKIDLRLPMGAEEQIARAVKKELDEKDIPPQNSGYDSFGRGTVGYAFSQAFGATCPVAIDSGQKCTKRPVRQDLFVYEEDNRGRKIKRLKRCDEHYSKFITEMWFSVRYLIEADQMRELPVAVMEEGTWRVYQVVEGNKIEVEAKDDMRHKKNQSPDLFDWLAIAVEMARRHGLVIERIGVDEEVEDANDWIDDLLAKQRRRSKDWVLKSY